MRRRNISARKAASEAGLSDARWRHIVNGYRSEGGSIIPVIAPSLTLARMAKAMGITPDELRDAGRTDAADDLERLKPPSIPTQRQSDDITEELMTLARAYNRLPEEDRKQIRGHLDMVNTWAAGRIEQIDAQTKRHSRRAG